MTKFNKCMPNIQYMIKPIVSMILDLIFAFELGRPEL